MALGEGVRPRRGRAALTLRRVWDADRSRGLAGGARVVRLAARRPHRRRARRLQPLLRLVLAGGALGLAARADGGAHAAVPRAALVRLVGADRRARALHPLLRGLPAGAGGDLAPVARSPGAVRVARDRLGGRGGHRVDPAGAAPARPRPHVVHRGPQLPDTRDRPAEEARDRRARHADPADRPAGGADRARRDRVRALARAAGARDGRDRGVRGADAARAGGGRRRLRAAAQPDRGVRAGDPRGGRGPRGAARPDRRRRDLRRRARRERGGRERREAPARRLARRGARPRPRDRHARRDRHPAVREEAAPAVRRLAAAAAPPGPRRARGGGRRERPATEGPRAAAGLHRGLAREHAKLRRRSLPIAGAAALRRRRPHPERTCPVTDRPKIAALPGDGIGPEIMAAARPLLDALGDFEIEEHPVGGASIDAHGTALTPEVLEACRKADAVLLAAVGGPKWDGTEPGAPRPEQGLLGLRKGLGLYANLRPVRPARALLDSSPLKRDRIEGTDLLVVRELTGGIYFGDRGRRDADGSPGAYDTCVYS